MRTIIALVAESLVAIGLMFTTNLATSIWKLDSADPWVKGAIVVVWLVFVVITIRTDVRGNLASPPNTRSSAERETGKPLEPTDNSPGTKDVQDYPIAQKAGLEQNNSHESLRDMFYKSQRQTDEFSRRISSTLLAPSEFSRVTDPANISRLLAALAPDCESYNLWWKCACLQPLASPGDNGSRIDVSDSPVHVIRRLNDQTWLIDGQEIQIAEACICRARSRSWRHFVVLQLKPMAPFFGGPDDRTSERCADYAGFSQGRYIPDDLYNNQLDDVVRYQGEEVNLRASDHGQRVRFLKNALMFLAPQLSVVFDWSFRFEFERVATAILESGKVDEEILAPFYGMAENLPPVPDYIAVSD